jgi:uridine phosphorylase
MGGPSASVVLQDLAELGLRQAIRIGTCTALWQELELGQMTIVAETFPEPAGPYRPPEGFEEPGQPVVEPDPRLTLQLSHVLGEEASGVVSVSLDVLHRPELEVHPAAEVADMQTAALFATGREFEVAVAALLIVAQTREGRTLADDQLEAAAKRAGRAAASVLSA